MQHVNIPPDVVFEEIGRLVRCPQHWRIPTMPGRHNYRRRLIAVALHTVNSALSCNPFAFRMRSAHVEEAHLLMISSTWDVTDRSFVNRTPRIFSSETLSI